MKKENQILIKILYILSCIIFSITYYLNRNFVKMNFEQILFTLIRSDGTSYSGVVGGAVFTLIATAFSYLGLMLLYFLRANFKKIIIKYENDKQITIFPIQNILAFVIILFLLSLIAISNQLNIFQYFKNQVKESNFYETYYVDPNSVDIEFNHKRNLIYIYLESMESTVLSKENGGESNLSYIPKLEQLALTNTNFSHNDKLGGAHVLRNTGWTIAGLVAQTAGISLNIPIDGNLYTSYSAFLPGVTSLGKILEDNGYKNYLMLGSKASFGGRDEYFSQHGNYKIYDYDTAILENKIGKDYYVWWGYEDKKLFQYAKEKLTEISKSDEPFNFTMLTVDTHFESGYLDETCSDLPFNNQYANVFYCNSNMIYNFINWIMKQDFYKNTTIVLSGDHNSMQLFDFEIENTRRTYNVFINSLVNPTNSKNREFATVDMFPTTLAAIGAKIEGNRLGLGTDLFSDKETLIEELGLDYINNEIAKRSKYYNNNFLGNSYLEMIIKANE